MRRLLATGVMLLVAASLGGAQVGAPVARPQGVVTRPGDPVNLGNGTTFTDDSARHFCFAHDANCRSRLGLQGPYVPYAYIVPMPLYEAVPPEVVGPDDAQDADLQAEVARQRRANRDLQVQLARERASREAAPPAFVAQPAAGKSDPPPPLPDEPDGPTTILVFRDGTHTEVLNYAIVGDTLFELDARATKKLPLSELDIPATIKLNNERGVTFLAPGKS